MGGNISTVHIANAYPGDIWVKVKSERLKTTTTTSKLGMAVSANISGLLQMDLGSAGAKIKKHHKTGYSAEYHQLLEAGFTKMKSGTLTPYSPPQDHKDKDRRRVFVTIKTVDAYSEVEVIAENLACEEFSNFIITKEGCITKARLDLSKAGTNWVDLDGEEHIKPSCPKCLEQKRACTVCLFEAKGKVFKKCILNMKNCKISDGLTTTIAEMETKHYVAKSIKAKEMLDKIKELASKYFVLEGRTRKCVLTIKSYGESLVEAVEDFRLDHDWSSLFWEIQNFDAVKKSLDGVTDIHNAIKGEVELIQKSAKKEHEMADKKLKKAEKNDRNSFDTGDKVAMPIFLTPGVGQVAGGICGVAIGASAAIDMIDGWELPPVASVPLKFVGGGLGALGGGAVGTIISMPGAACYVFGTVIYIKDAVKYKELSDKFLAMGTQMEMVGARLDEITNALEIIDVKFAKSKKAEDKLNFQIEKNSDRDILKSQASKIEGTATELIEACDDYLGLVKQDVEKTVEQIC